MEDHARTACGRLFVAEGRSILLPRDEWRAEAKLVVSSTGVPHTVVYACRILRSAAAAMDHGDNALAEDWEAVARLLEFIDVGVRCPPPKDGMPLLALAVAEVSCALPALLLASWRHPDSASVFQSVIAVTRALCAVQSSEEDAARRGEESWASAGQSHAGVALRSLRLMELAAICCSRATDDTIPAAIDGHTDDTSLERSPESVSLADVPHARSPSAIRPAVVRDEGVRLAEALVSRVHAQCMSVASPSAAAIAPASAALAGASLLGHLVRVRPSFLPWVVPALVALHEAFGTASDRGSYERGFVRRALDRQLSALMDLSAAERFVPLLGSALTRTAHDDTDLSAMDAGDAADVMRAAPATRPPAAVSAAKSTTQRTQPELSVAHVPLPATCEIVLRTLARIDMAALPAAIEDWRPSPSGVAPLTSGVPSAKKQMPEADPRRSHTEAAPSDEPYELVPRTLSLRDASEALRTALRAALSAAGDLSGGASRVPKKARLRLLVRLCVVLDVLASSPGTGAATVLDFCFGDLSSRCGLLLHWLRTLWVCGMDARGGLSGGDGAGASSEDCDAYADAYGRTIARLSGMAEENVPAWDTSATRILGDVPELVGDAHEAMLRGALAAQQSRAAARETIEAIARDRPASRTSLLLSVLLPATGATAGGDDGLRKAAVFAVTDAFAMLGDPAVDAAIDMHTAKLLGDLSSGESIAVPRDEDAPAEPRETTDAGEPGACVDLPLRLALRKPAVFAQRFVHALSTASPNAVEYALVQAGALAPVVKAPGALLNALSASVSGEYGSPLAENTPPDALPAMRLVRRLIDAMAKAGTLAADALVILWAQIRSGTWPAALLDTTAAFVTRDDLLALLDGPADAGEAPSKRLAIDAPQPQPKRRRRTGRAPQAEDSSPEAAIHDAPAVARSDTSLVARYVAQVEPAAERPAVVAAYTHIAEKIGPADFLVLLHTLEGAVPLRRCLAAIQLCLAIPTVFRTEIVSLSMRTLLDRAGYAPGRDDARGSSRAQPKAPAVQSKAAPLPTLFMRTLLEALRLYRGSFAPFALGVLRVLAENEAEPRIWKRPAHWEGWLRCARVLLPSSTPLLAALPHAVLSSLGETAPDLHDAAKSR